MPKIRINKYLADCGLCSRREAEKWITQGLVQINGKPAKPGDKVDISDDHISCNGKRVRRKTESSLTLVVNKSRGLVCSNQDPHNPRTVFDLLPASYRKRRLFCAGRLDKDSEGLVILTDDGNLCQQLTHPSNGISKRYRVLLDKDLDFEHIPEMLKGKVVQGEKLYAEKIIPASRGHNFSKRLEVHLVQGRKREIRRLFEVFGYRIKRLRRFQMGRFQLKRIAQGGYRKLNPRDIEMLLKNPATSR